MIVLKEMDILKANAEFDDMMGIKHKLSECQQEAVDQAIPSLERIVVL